MSRPAWERAILALLLIYFALRAIHLAWVTPASIPPDEFSHFGRAVVFSQAAWLPPDGPDSYRYGLMRDTPYLYSLAMGKLLALNALPIDDLRFLRLVNVVIGVLTVWIAMRAMALLSSDPIARVLFGVMITNTLMLTFLSASVSYDNGANLCAALAFACLFAFMRWQRPAHLAGLALALLAGTLTMKTLLPLAALRRSRSPCWRR